ncbi:calcium/sodium antiporter [Oceanirhabdus sp. W0125-5]|uniref:calcium/sodium antiporter n=1 Tax=Oceanirhabdus sp. W0125-5 TaxID=2999116 RepID=UPI0022F2CC2E|nr:calcium/sodium antiporter [Oceanirhabdus sp. W0125-5]WBW99363.1 calcium/sodium antiporter [Oceanirhabdus sp. W0125-5]
MNYLLLILGFILLIKGADILVDGASSIAKILKVPSIIIGLTIVAFGTSAPELAVSIKSALSGSPDIATGNIAGSSIFNLLLVVGITALIKKIEVEKSVLVKDFPFLILITFGVMVLCGDVFFSGADINILTRGDGLVLISFFSIFMFYLVGGALSARNKALEEAAAALDAGMVVDEKEEKSTILKYIFMVILGLVGVVLGGDWVVESSREIALSLGMSETLVGLTIVAMGTSLPELVTSLVAAKKGESDMVIGNIIGSNVFNLLLVLGVTSSISPIVINGNLIVDMLYLLVVSIITYLIMSYRKILNRSEGVVFTLLYVAYAVFIIIRN